MHGMQCQRMALVALSHMAQIGFPWVTTCTEGIREGTVSDVHRDERIGTHACTFA
jgi:hypothetical protein